MMNNKDKGIPHFVTSHDFHGDAEYIAWLHEIKRRYQRIRSRIALQANYGMLEFNWLLGRDLVEKKAEQRWGAGVVEQLSLELQAIENQNPIKLHQLGAEIASPSRVATILDNGDMLPLFGIVPWKHHVKLLEAQLEQNDG